MNYEISGLDPASLQEDPNPPFHVWHYRTKNSTVYVLNPSAMEQTIAAGQRITLVDEGVTGTSHITHIAATVQGGQNYDNHPAALYSATITLSQEEPWLKEFLARTDANTYPNLKATPFYWDNVRLLQRPGTRLIMQATLLGASITLRNQEVGNNPYETPLLSTALTAPASADVDGMTQLAHSLDCLTAMMGIAHNLGRKKTTYPGKTFIMTPNGPLYHNPDTGDYKHRLGLETITVSPPKRAKKEHPSLDELFGIEDIKAQLAPIISFYKRTDIAAKWGITHPGNLLLQGPPGTGKTAVVHALAQAIGADVKEVGPADIYRKWMGRSEKAMKAIFDSVRDVEKPTILFFDGIESSFTTEESQGYSSRANNSVSGIFRTEAEKIAQENPNVLLAATTSSIDRLDPALIRAGRFGVQIAMSPPNDEARRQLFGNLIINHSNQRFNPFKPELLEANSLAELVKITDHNFTVADIIEALRSASSAKASEEERTGKEPPPIDLAFLKGIILSMRRNRP